LIVQYVVKDEDEDKVPPPNAEPEGKAQQNEANPPKAGGGTGEH
jgi:hypothetical protein